MHPHPGARAVRRHLGEDPQGQFHLCPVLVLRQPGADIQLPTQRVYAQRDGAVPDRHRLLPGQLLQHTGLSRGDGGETTPR